MSGNINLRGLQKFQKGGSSVFDAFRKGQLDVSAEVARLIKIGHTVGFLSENVSWIEQEVQKLADMGYWGRLYWDLPPEIITTAELISEADRYRDKGAPRANNDSFIWAAGQDDAITKEQWEGPSRPPAIRLAVARAKEDDPSTETDPDPVLHGLSMPYEEQIALVENYMEQFQAYHEYTLESLTHKGICSILLSDRIDGVPTESRILAHGFMLVMFGWWHLYGNKDIPRCGSVTLSSDWFIMNESAGYPYPSDGFGLSIGVKNI